MSDGGRFTVNASDHRDDHVNKFVVDVDGGASGKGGFLDFYYPWRPNNGNFYIEDMCIFGNNYLGLLNWDRAQYRNFYIRNGINIDNIVKHMFFSTAFGPKKATYYRDASGYYSIRPSGEDWSGVPEPETYGAIVSASALGLALISRRKRKREAGALYLTAFAATQRGPEVG